MDANTLLTERCSVPRLTSPGPTGETLNLIKQAALRAPDHAGLKPWQFLVFDNEDALKDLGEVFVKAALIDDPDAYPGTVDRARQLPMRAPLVIVCATNKKDNPKVPEWEQELSAGCAVMAMQQAAFANGFGGIWRTGVYAESATVKQLLGIAEKDKIVGFLYIGTPVTTPCTPVIPETDKFFTQWESIE